MKTLIIYPENKEQLAALKIILKALKISFEKDKSPYDPEFVAKIKESREQVKKGETREVNATDL